MGRTAHFSFRFILSFCLLLLLAAMVGGCSTEKDITIGAVLILETADGKPLTVGEDILEGMRMAVATINEQGGIGGATLRLVHADCKADPARAVEIVREIAASEPAAIVSMCSHISSGIADVCAELKIPQVAILATAEDVILNAPYTYRYWPWAAFESGAALPIIRKLEVGTLGLVNIDNTYGNSVSDELATLLAAEDIASVKLAYTTPDQELAARLAALADCDAIYFTCFPDQLEKLASILRSVYPDMPLIGSNSIASPVYAPLAVMDGVYLAAPLIYSPSYALARDMGQSYLDKTGRKLDHYSGIGFDSINLLAQLMLRGGSRAEDVKAMLDEGFVYPGLFGDVDKKADAHQFSFPLSPAHISAGTVVYEER